MRRATGFLFVFLTACNGPQFGFNADRSEEVSVGGHRFVVHLAQDRAQVVRLNRIALGQAKEAARAAKKAAEIVSGCEAGPALKGSDQVLLHLELDCP